MLCQDAPESLGDVAASTSPDITANSSTNSAPGCRPSIIPDCVGHITTFVVSPVDFFNILVTSRLIFDFFHSYGFGTCQHINFRISQNIENLSEVYLVGKPYILRVTISLCDPRQRNKPTYDGNFEWMGHLQFVRRVHFGSCGKEFHPWVILKFPAQVRRCLREISVGGFLQGASIQSDSPTLREVLEEFTQLERFEWWGHRGGYTDVQWHGDGHVGIPDVIDLPPCAFREVSFRDTILKSNAFVLSSTRSLRMLTLHRFEMLDVSLPGFEAFFSALSSLEILSVFHLTGVHDEGKYLPNFLPYLPSSVRDFNLRREKRTTARSDPNDVILTRALMTKLPLFEKFRLCGFVADGDFLLGLGSANLRFMWLDDLKSTIDHAELSFPEFERLELFHCRSIYEYSLNFMDCSWPKLREFLFLCDNKMGSFANVLSPFLSAKIFRVFECYDLQAAMFEEAKTFPPNSLCPHFLELERIRKPGVSCLLAIVDPEELVELKLTVDVESAAIPEGELLRFHRLRKLYFHLPVSIIDFSFLEVMPLLEELWFRGNSEVFPLEILPPSLERMFLYAIQAVEVDLTHLVHLKKLTFELKPEGKLTSFALPLGIQSVSVAGAELRSLSLDEEQFRGIERLQLSGTSEEQQGMLKREGVTFVLLPSERPKRKCDVM